MMNFKDKILYCLALVALLFIGIGVGYVKTVSLDKIGINNTSVLEFAKNFSLTPSKELTVTASTKTYDITVTYEDYYTVCNETVASSNVIYGTNIDKVKEDEEEYQKEKGLVYTIKEESEDSIIYTRTINENCPNHFKLIYEEDKINVYSVKGEDNMVLYMSIDDINIENLRDELKQKVKRGTYINSKEELNRFIEDLES